MCHTCLSGLLLGCHGDANTKGARWHASAGSGDGTQVTSDPKGFDRLTYGSAYLLLPGSVGLKPGRMSLWVRAVA